MKTKLMALMLMISLPGMGICKADSMSTKMPVMHTTGTMTVKQGEDWANMTGFGKDANMAAMMTLMMVGGSGMEGMSMASMSSDASSSSMANMVMSGSNDNDAQPTQNIKVTLNPNPPVVGDNKLDLLIKNLDGSPKKGLKLTATVAMTAMDMGTAHPAVQEGADGHYSLTANFAMAGIWRVSLTSASSDANSKFSVSYDFDAGSKKVWVQPQSNTIKMLTPKDAKVGSNTLSFMMMDGSGKPLTGVDVTATVAMISMDMGTSHDKAVGDKRGQYSVPVTFAMQGPWRVTLNAKLPGGKQVTQSFDFDVK